MQYFSIHKKILLIFLFLFILIILYFVFSTSKKDTKQSIQRKDYESAIALINEKLPIQLDTETEFKSVQLQDNIIEYKYQLIKKEKFEVKVAELQEAFKKEMLKNYCANSDMMIAFRKSGYTTRYIYLDSKSQEIFSIEMTPNICTSLER